MSWFSQGVEFVENVVSDTAQKVGTEVKKDAGAAIDQVRTGVANGLTLYGAGITTAVAQGIAPAGAKPIVIPLTAAQVGWIVAVLALLFVVFLSYAL